ncbi:hypothetical protein ACH5RR_041221 [Cinchona calisaya]|uniref:KIB1-4 beta-propeller domain-containing protein n=1 Tax=Cinchona calisaya TaxID=153742 RepID=A0ABD2XW66_9GENT
MRGGRDKGRSSASSGRRQTKEMRLVIGFGDGSTKQVRSLRLVEDFVAFGGVCSSWRTAATKDNFVKSWPTVPLLMLVEEKHSDYRKFLVYLKARFGGGYLSPKQKVQICLPNPKTFPEYENYKPGLSDDEEETYGATNFGVIQLDLNKSIWEKVTSLGEKAIFLGHNSAFSVDATSFSGVIKSNCIYFTDDCIEAYFHTQSQQGGGKDMGIYNLEDGKIERFDNVQSFSLICPPVWVAPSF